jgi:hypothetical protein
MAGASRSEPALNPNTAEEARESRESPRMERTASKRKLAAFFKGNFSHPLHCIRVHWFYSRAKSGSGLNPSAG